MQMIPLSSIKENPNNPRFIRDNRFEDLKRSLRDFPKGLELRPIIIESWENRTIIGGNMRRRALEEIGYKEIPKEWLKTAEDFTAEELQRFLITDNVGYGEWDRDLLQAWNVESLLDFGMTAEQLEAINFDEPEEEPEAEEDDYDAPEVDQVETDIKSGDLIEIGPHRLLCGDSTNPENYSKLFEEAEADLVMTDPPYNVDYEGGTGLKIMNDKMENSAFYQFLLDFFTAQYDYLKPGGGVYVWHADSEGRNFRAAFQDSGLLLKQCLVWVKNSLVLGRQDYQWRHEPCLYGWKPGAAHYFVDERYHTTVIEDEADFKKMTKAQMREMLEAIFENKAGTVLRADKPRRNDVHPTMKPILLLAPLIQNSSKPGQIISDPFGGSGSTMVAAEQLDRICYMMEMDPRYCQVIVDRMRKLAPDIEVRINKKII